MPGATACARYRRGSAYAEAVRRAAVEAQPPTSANATTETAARAVAGRLGVIVPGLAAAGIVVGLGFAHGGYFPTAWGPTTLVLLAASAAALATGTTTSLGLRTLVIPVSLGVLCVWILASSVWGSPTEAVPESQRTLVYVSGALALALVLRRGSTIGVLIGVWARDLDRLSVRAGHPAVPGADRGHSTRFAGYRLSAPDRLLERARALRSARRHPGVRSRRSRGATRRQAFRCGIDGPSCADACTSPSAGEHGSHSRSGWSRPSHSTRTEPGQAVVLAIVAPWPALAVLIASSSGPLSETRSHTGGCGRGRARCRGDRRRSHALGRRRRRTARSFRAARPPLRRGTSGRKRRRSRRRRHSLRGLRRRARRARRNRPILCCVNQNRHTPS